MKREFEEIKAEMEQTWNEQQALHEDQLARQKSNYDKRLEFEMIKNEDLCKENELLRQKIARIKDVFIDNSEQRSRPQQQQQPPQLNQQQLRQQMHQDVHPG